MMKTLKNSLFSTLAAVTLCIIIGNDAMAEMAHLPAAQPFPPEREVFYIDDNMTAYKLMEGCGFLGKNIDNVPPLSAECAGYLHAMLGMFHNEYTTSLMLETQCYDLFEQVPDWGTPIITSFLKHANAAKPAQLKREEALKFIIDSVVKDYPCKDPKSDGVTKGTQKAPKP